MFSSPQWSAGSSVPYTFTAQHDHLQKIYNIGNLGNLGNLVAILAIYAGIYGPPTTSQPGRRQQVNRQAKQKGRFPSRPFCIIAQAGYQT